jgi:hypothetical protein
MSKGKSYRAQMDANLGVPPDHPANHLPKRVPATPAHPGFRQQGVKKTLQGPHQPHHEAHAGSVRGTLRTGPTARPKNQNPKENVPRVTHN